MHAAVDYAEVERLLIAEGNVNAFSEGKTPIEVAVERQDERMVKLLLKYGANPRYSSRNLLQLAAANYQTAVCEVLKPYYSSSERCAVDC